MKRGLLLFALMIPIILFAQTQEVTKLDQFANNVEKYHVLEGNSDIKDGGYKAYNGGNLMIEGFYKDNLKDSVWKYYTFSGQVQLQGSFQNDKRVGIWTAYSRGQVQVQYNYTKNELLFFKPTPVDSLKMYPVIKGSDTVEMKLERCPVFLDGPNRLFLNLAKSIRYPVAARQANIQGDVVVAFTINTDGSLTNFKVKKGLGYGLDQEALKAVTSMEGKWLPGLSNGIPVTVQYLMPVKFALSNQVVYK
ncbi:energy transducer TonB [Mucilaginibacter glaciei]|uniref:TonB family protein n=1 Tax=Mucilaginibacter glaciei TaxID=2772109 RepID=A0A926NLU6_9SPHI|nr:energy transducer TonB [Mucilaginibacter glaciei]MBD1393576.1 TonB family protein [Mucilaginibacter glaciei]